MKAVYVKQQQVHVGELEQPTIGATDVLVRIKAAGLNRRDLYTPNRLAPDAAPLILGSDAAGVIEAIGNAVTRVQVGDEVIVNPSLRWYDESAVPPDDFEILSLPDHGTFAEFLAISEEQVEAKPAHLSFVEAATIGIAPLTGYRAVVTKGQVKAGDTVFIPGAGSGVATFMIPFAKSLGARVIVSSRSAEKREAARKLGADIVLDNDADWPQELANETIDTVIESVGRATFNRSLAVLKRGGTMVVFGATTEDIVDFDLRAFFYAQQTLKGSTLGSREEFRAMLQMLEQQDFHPVVDRTYSLDEAADALKYLEINEQFGKLVFEVNN